MTRRHHTFIHVSALVFTQDGWTPPDATAYERAIVARFGGYRVHESGAITLGDAQTREDLAFLDDVTLLAFCSEERQLEIAQSLFGRRVSSAVPAADWDQSETPQMLAELVRATGARLEEVYGPIDSATVVYGRAPKWKSRLQQDFATGGVPDTFVTKASLVTGYVNTDQLSTPLDDVRRTLIIDLEALLDDQNSFTRRGMDQLHTLAHDVGAYRTVIRTGHWSEIPPGRHLTEILVPGQYAEVVRSTDGSQFAEQVAATSHYRRSLTDDIVTLRGTDELFWADFDSRAWMLGAPVSEVALDAEE